MNHLIGGKPKPFLDNCCEIMQFIRGNSRKVPIQTSEQNRTPIKTNGDSSFGDCHREIVENHTDNLKHKTINITYKDV